MAKVFSGALILSHLCQLSVAAGDLRGSHPPAAGFDCAAGFANWKNGWSDMKKVWCCKQHEKGCETPTPAPEPFDCDAGFNGWKKGWSDGKMKWCCKNHKKGCVAQQKDDMPMIVGIGFAALLGLLLVGFLMTRRRDTKQNRTLELAHYDVIDFETAKQLLEQELTSLGSAAVANVAEALQKYPTMSIKIEGHTGCECDGECTAKELSYERAEKVRQALQNQGCNHDITVDGFGCEQRVGKMVKIVPA